VDGKAGAVMSAEVAEIIRQTRRTLSERTWVPHFPDWNAGECCLMSAGLTSHEAARFLPGPPGEPPSFDEMMATCEPPQERPTAPRERPLPTGRTLLAQPQGGAREDHGLSVREAGS
jgi:hypothetical protein